MTSSTAERVGRVLLAGRGRGSFELFLPTEALIGQGRRHDAKLDLTEQLLQQLMLGSLSGQAQVGQGRRLEGQGWSLRSSLFSS